MLGEERGEQSPHERIRGRKRTEFGGFLGRRFLPFPSRELLASPMSRASSSRLPTPRALHCINVARTKIASSKSLHVVSPRNFARACISFAPPSPLLKDYSQSKGRFTRYDFGLRLSHAIFIARAARVMEKSYRFPRYKIACRYGYRGVLKHVSKAHDILRVIHDNRKQVVGLIYTKRFLS